MFKLPKINLWISLSLILALLITISIAALWNFLPPKLPLFYSLPWGDNQLGNRAQLLIIPGIIILVTLFNLILSWQLHSSQSFFKKILLFSSLLASLILTITFLKIVSIFL